MKGQRQMRPEDRKRLSDLIEFALGAALATMAIMLTGNLAAGWAVAGAWLGMAILYSIAVAMRDAWQERNDR